MSRSQALHVKVAWETKRFKHSGVWLLRVRHAVVGNFVFTGLITSRAFTWEQFPRSIGVGISFP